MIFVVHEWVTTEDGVCWTSLCSYSFFFPFFFFIMIEGEIGERDSPKQMAISDWPIQGLTIDLLRRELYDSREGDWDFFTEKKTKRFVISSPGSFRHR